ncbi:MAG: Ig-like domain-containing protein, partial [Marmoricola sp.]
RQHDQTTWTKIAESHGALDLVIDAAQRVSTVGYDLSGTSGRFLLVPVPAGDGRPTANIPGNLFDNVGGSARQAPDGSIYFIDESNENQQTVLRIKRAAPPATNAAPVAADSTRTVPGGQSSGLVLSASDPDGDALTYDVVTAPAHGSLAGTAPDLTYTPAAGYTGPDSLAYSVSDGNGGSTSATVAITVTAPGGVSSVTQHAEPGQSVSTGAAPSSGEPAQAAVTTPAAGSISIAQDPTIADPAGYAVLGSQVRIEAPAATTAAPLRLTFQLDATALPSGESAESVTVFRNGDPIARCTGEVGEATPDPCVTSRTTSEDGVVTITVLSSHASEWTLGVALKATTTTVHPVAASTYGQAVSLVATVNQPGTSSPTGSVTFKDTSANPAKVLGTATLSGGSATLPNQVLDAGEHAVVAVYSGSRTSAASTSAPVVVKVAKAPVSVTTSSTSGFVSLLTFRVGYTSTVKSTVTGLPLAGITVTTRVTGGSVNTGCTAVTNTNGVATCTAGPVQISILTPYAASTAATANYLAGTGQGFVRLF